jgi:adenylyltransferase/sulfurtransferase
MNEITVNELNSHREQGTDLVLIDVREQHEYDNANLKGLLIPMGTVLENLDKIPKDKMVVVHCRSGARSAAVIRELETNHGYENLYNLKGGITAWVSEIDPSLNL